MIWGAELERELAGLGELKSHPGGSCLAHCMHKPPIIRHIISGQVDIFAHTATGKAHICRCAEGEFLGIHSNLYHGAQAAICWKTVNNMECMEIPWSEVTRISRKNARVESILQHICQIRQYSIVLATHPVFSCLDIDERARLFDHAKLRILTPGEHLIRKHGEKAHLYLLVSGSVGIHLEDKSVIPLGNGDILGEISLFGFNPRPTADAVAESLTEIIEFLDTDMLAIMQENTEFRLRMTELIGSRAAP